MNSPTSCRGPLGISRRQMLQVGGIGLWGLGLPGLLKADEARRAANLALTPKADACILVFLNGGPSQLDMWDMKPNAPEAIRGEFKPIDTSLPGLLFSEHMPRFARVAHLGTVIRSAHHGVNNSHAAAVYCGLTGHDRGELGGGFKPTDNPSIGSVVGMLRPPQLAAVPYVSLPYWTAEGAGGPPQPGFTGGWLGRSLDPLWVLRDPNDAGFGMPEMSLPPGVDMSRSAGRKRLVGELGAPPAGLSSDQRLRDMDTFQAKAFDLLSAPATRAAFQLDREDPRVRDRYGRNIYGQSILLARRLIEAGTRVACISWAPDANATWDTHGNNFTTLKTTLLPQLDAAVPSLIEDLFDRGMLERTLVVVMGEFGRSPKVNAAAGRDHWNFGYSLFLAGGGIKPGFVYGASDKIAARPALDPVTPAEIIGTIYHCLGIPPEYELHDQLGRPLTVVPNGKAIGAVLS
ncbi:MAG: hypothetical protein JWN86_1889 [Planctomycetota bacterium]|nr:hypothetical protein [Planctomycetota bacterium]